MRSDLWSDTVWARHQPLVFRQSRPRGKLNVRQHKLRKRQALWLVIHHNHFPCLIAKSRTAYSSRSKAGIAVSLNQNYIISPEKFYQVLAQISSIHDNVISFFRTVGHYNKRRRGVQFWLATCPIRPSLWPTAMQRQNQNSPNNLRLPLNDLKYLSKVPCIHWVLTPKPKCLPISLHERLFSKKKRLKRLSKIGYCTEWPQTHHKHLTAKMPYMQRLLATESQICTSFALQSAVFEIKSCQKSQIHRLTSDWP